MKFKVILTAGVTVLAFSNVALAIQGSQSEASSAVSAGDVGTTLYGSSSPICPPCRH